MKWKCKFCVFTTNGQGRIIQHYKKRHRHHRRSSGLVCIYEDCLSTFQTQAELKNHLKEHVKEGKKIVTKLCCDLCTFSEPSDINKYYPHLKTHLRNREIVKCPFADCSFKSSILPTFTAHRSRYHKFSTPNSLRPELCVDHTLTKRIVGVREDSVSDTEKSPSYDPIPEAEPLFENGEAIKNQLASLLLRMQTILHVSNSAIQEVIDELFDIGEFANQNIKKIIQKVLDANNCVADASVVASLSDEMKIFEPTEISFEAGAFGHRA